MPAGAHLLACLCLGLQAAEAGEQRPSVLLVGNPALVLKGFECAIATLGLVNRTRPIEVSWGAFLLAGWLGMVNLTFGCLCRGSSSPIVTAPHVICGHATLAGALGVPAGAL